MTKYYIDGKEREVKKAFLADDADSPVFAQLTTKDNKRLDRRVYQFKNGKDRELKLSEQLFVKINKSMFSISDLEKSGYKVHVYFL